MFRRFHPLDWCRDGHHRRRCFALRLYVRNQGLCYCHCFRRFGNEHTRYGALKNHSTEQIFEISPFQIRSQVKWQLFRTSMRMPASATLRAAMRSTCSWVSALRGQWPPSIIAATATSSKCHPESKFLPVSSQLHVD